MSMQFRDDTASPVKYPKVLQIAKNVRDKVTFTLLHARRNHQKYLSNQINWQHMYLAHLNAD